MKKREMPPPVKATGRALRSFTGSIDECDDFLLNSGFRHNGGSWLHPNLIHTRTLIPRNGRITIKVYQR